MRSISYFQVIKYKIQSTVGLKIDRRTQLQLKEHYEIERKLATRLRDSSREERSHLYASLYDELFRRVPHLSQLAQNLSSKDISRKGSHQLGFIRRFLDRDTVFLEIGAGDCALSLTVADFVKKVYALEVSTEITSSLLYPQNFELLLFDGFSIPLPLKSIAVAYSNQVMEHLHPDDVLEQLKGIHQILNEHGIYICATPNRLSGPHDISKYFDVVASGFHLKEYTYIELSDLFKQVGFSKVKAYLGAKGIYFRFPLLLLRSLEKLLMRLPHSLSRAIARLLLLFNIRLVGMK